MRLRLRASANEWDAPILEAVELSDDSEIPGPDIDEMMRRRDGTVFRSDMATLVLLEQILLELRSLRGLLEAQPNGERPAIDRVTGENESASEEGSP